MATYTQTYNSFSGVDMLVTFGGKLVGELQGISYTITREVAPLYTMGSADPRSFSRGKRGIAGSMVFLVFDRDALLSTLANQSKYVANAYELFQGQEAVPINENATLSAISSVDGSIGVRVERANASTRAGNVITTDKVIASPRYADQIPPFDVVISAANEYGHMASMVIGGCQVMNCGSSMSIDDITTDQACTFVATHMKPWSNQYHIDIKNNLGAVPYQGFNSSYPGPVRAS